MYAAGIAASDCQHVMPSPSAALACVVRRDFGRALNEAMAARTHVR
jgi:hypothetical protein